MKKPPWQCDKCGRFAKMETGSSQVFVPDSDVSYEEIGFRCRSCTAKYGKIKACQTVNNDICSWIL